MEDEDPQALRFRIGGHVLVVTMRGESLRLRVESAEEVRRIFFREISAECFPDNIRHSPLNSPHKIEDYLRQHQASRLTFHNGNLILILNEEKEEEHSEIIIEMVQFTLEEAEEEKEEEEKKTRRRKADRLKLLNFWDKTTKYAKQYSTRVSNLRKKEEGRWLAADYQPDASRRTEWSASGLDQSPSVWRTAEHWTRGHAEVEEEGGLQWGSLAAGVSRDLVKEGAACLLHLQ